MRGELSTRRRELAAELGRRRNADGVAAVFSSDLRRAAETATVAFNVVIGHVATRWSIQHLVDGESLADVVDTPFGWQEGWEYRLERAPR